jgi:hypothetical protein
MRDDPDLDQLREATDHGDYLDEAAGADVYEDLRESMVESLEEIDEGCDGVIKYAVSKHHLRDMQMRIRIRFHI